MNTYNLIVLTMSPLRQLDTLQLSIWCHVRSGGVPSPRHQRGGKRARRIAPLVSRSGRPLTLLIVQLCKLDKRVS